LANVSALTIWLAIVVIEQRINLVWWIQTLALTASISFSGWFADRLWYHVVASRLERPFGLSAYVSRLPFYFVLSGIFFTILMFLAGINRDFQPALIALVGGGLQCGVQIPYQWHLFNRLRKLVLTEL
jgi:hypothetical protein